MEHKIYDEPPSGYTLGDHVQRTSFERTGSVNGASKVCLVRNPDEAVIAQDARNLEAAGPDEFPTGYFRHLAERRTAIVAARLRPPRNWADIGRGLIEMAAYDAGATNGAEATQWYIREYQQGFADGKRSRGRSKDSLSQAYYDGLLDSQAGRPKWHLTYCLDHDHCQED